MMRRALWVAACTMSVVGAFVCRPAVAFAQRAEHRVSTGGGVSGFGLFDEAGRPITSPGAAVWVTVRGMGPLALEAQVDWFPSAEAIEFESQGGRTLKLTAGPRATFFLSKRLRIDGLMRGGFIRFSETMTGRSDGVRIIGPRAHGAMDLGAGFELFPGAQWRPRFDFVTTFYAVPGATLGTPGGDGRLVATTSAKIRDTYQVNAGLTYGFGGPRITVPSSSAGGPWTLGAQLSYTASTNLLDLEVRHRGGIGGFVSYRFSRFVEADGAVSAFPQTTRARSPWDGGRVLQALAGVKVGVREGRVAAFAKVRGGVNSHADALKSLEWFPFSITRGRSNLPVLDIGGVVEIAAASGLLLRVDAGDAITFYPDRTIVLDGVAAPQGRGPSQQQMQFTIAVGWRLPR